MTSFNGAALFQVRKVGSRRRHPRWKRNWLQWGRTFSSAESSMQIQLLDALHLRFNGAALFQVRKE